MGSSWVDPLAVCQCSFTQGFFLRWVWGVFGVSFFLLKKMDGWVWAGKRSPWASLSESVGGTPCCGTVARATPPPHPPSRGCQAVETNRSGHLSSCCQNGREGLCVHAGTKRPNVCLRNIATVHWTRTATWTRTDTTPAPTTHAPAHKHQEETPPGQAVPQFGAPSG